MANITKRYPGTLALDDVSFDVPAGAFHALLGGNGSGKSTVIKVLAGVVSSDPGGSLRAGAMTVASERASATWAREAGIRFVHQDLGLFESLTVAENIALTAGFARRNGAIRWAEVRTRATALLDQIGLDISASAQLQSLRPAQKTLVAIARALDDRDGRVKMLVLDEPTARLPANEVDDLLAMLQELTGRGTSVLYVTHRLGEVLRMASSLTVLRDGRVVETRPAAGLDERALVELIVGRAIDGLDGAGADTPGRSTSVLTAEGLAGGAVRGVNLDLRRGEILGVGGTVGAGRTSLLRLIFGDVARLGGSISMEGKEVRLRSPRDAMKAGIAYLPENRVRDAGFMSLGLSENLSAATLQRYTSAGWLKRSEERADARNDLRTLRVRAPSIFAPLQSLSGGNQQKIVLARWLRMTTKVLLLDEPTQGVDAGARADIYDLITRAAADGLAVVVVSSDFEELAALCDRVVVLADGRLVAEGQKPSLTADWIAHHTHAATAARSSW